VGHLREHVMLDLEIQITREPGCEKVGGQVGCETCRTTNPIPVCVVVHNRFVSMVETKNTGKIQATQHNGHKPIGHVTKKRHG